MEPTTTDMSPPQLLGLELDSLVIMLYQLSDDSISCWGSNEFGQSGNGEIDGNLGVSTPYSIPEFGPGSNASLVRAGGHATCAVTTDGELYCWGYKALKGVTGNNQHISTPTHNPHPETNVTETCNQPPIHSPKERS